MAPENPNQGIPSQEDVQKKIEEARKMQAMKELRLKYDHKADNYDECSAWIDALPNDDFSEEIKNELRDKLDEFKRFDEFQESQKYVTPEERAMQKMQKIKQSRSKHWFKGTNKIQSAIEKIQKTPMSPEMRILAFKDKIREIARSKNQNQDEIGVDNLNEYVNLLKEDSEKKEFVSLLEKFSLHKNKDDWGTLENYNSAKLVYLNARREYEKNNSGTKQTWNGLAEFAYNLVNKERSLSPEIEAAKNDFEMAQKDHIKHLYQINEEAIKKDALDEEKEQEERKRIFRGIFEEQVVKTTQEMQKLEAETMHVRKKTIVEKVIRLYANQSKASRLVESAVLGTAIFGSISFVGGAAASIGFRAARGAAGAFVYKKVNNLYDKFVTKKIDQKQTQKIESIAQKVEEVNENEESALRTKINQALNEYQKTVQAERFSKARQKLYKTALGVVAGYSTSIAAGVGVNTFIDNSAETGLSSGAQADNVDQGSSDAETQKHPYGQIKGREGVYEGIHDAQEQDVRNQIQKIIDRNNAADVSEIASGQSVNQGSVNESVAEDPQAETEQGATSAEETAGAAVETNENIPNEAYIQKGDGYTHAYLRQLEANTNGIAEKLGFDSDASLAEKKVFVAKLAEKLGQLESVDVDGDGSISANEQWNAGKGLKYNPDKGLQIAVVLDVDANGNPVVQKFFEGKLVASKGIPGYEMSYGPAAGSGAAETTVDTDSRVLSKEELEQTAPQQAETQPTSGRVLSADELRQSVENQFKAPTGEYGDNTNTGRVLTREELLGTQKAETIGSRPGVQTIEGLGQYVTNSPYFKDFAFEFVRENGQIVSFNEFKGEFFADKYTLPGLREDWQSILESNSKFPVSKAEEYINNIKQAKALQELYQPGTPEYVFLQDKIIIKGETTLKDFGLFEEPAITTPEAPVETTRNITGAAANDFLVENNIHTNWRNQAGMLDAVTRAQVSGKLDEMAVYTQDLQGLEPGSPEYIETQSKIDAIETKLRETYGDSLFTDMRETAKAIDPKDYFTYNEEGEIKYARTPDVTGMATDLKLEELGIRTDWQDTPGLDKRSVVSRLQRTLDEYVAWNNAHEQFKNDLGVDSQEYGYAEAEMRKIEAKLREDYPTVFAGKDLDLTISGDKTFEQLLEEQGLEEKDIVSRGESAMKDELQRFLGDKDMNYKQGVWREMRNLSAKEVIDDGTGKYEKFDFKNIGALEKPEDRLTAYTSYLRNQLHLEPVGGEKLDDYLERARIELEKQKFISNNQ